MKLVIIFLSIAITLFFSLTEAWSAGDVILRFSSQDDSGKIVVEADDAIIKNSGTIATLNQIRIELVDKFELKKQKDFPFEVIKDGRFITIVLKDVTDVRAYKLSAPARIVVHLKIAFRAPSPSHKTDRKIVQETTKPVPDHKISISEKRQSLSSIVIDAGHGGYDFGIRSDQTKEKEINLIIAKELSDALLKKGFKPFLTRKSDQFISIHDRIQLANSRKPDLFISIHAFSGNYFALTVSVPDESQADPAVRLYSTQFRQLRHVDRSRAFAKNLSHMINTIYKTDVLVQEMSVPLLNSIDAPAVLIEYPSLTTSEYDQKVRGKFIDAVIRGIAAYEQ